MQKAYVEPVHLWQLLAKLVPLLCALADAEQLISELKAEMQIDNMPLQLLICSTSTWPFQEALQR
jgi:hypothetical protein